jgi:hypothetical protein
MVIVYPKQKRIAVDALSHSPAHNPLYLTVRQLNQNRQSLLQPGDKPARVEVRFLVHPDGDRSYHMAYPCLDSLKLPMSRITLHPKDDVARIIAEN